MGYSFRLTARFLLYAPSHRQDNTYPGLCYTSHGALAGTRNSSVVPPHEGLIRRPIAPWANAPTTELRLAPIKMRASLNETFFCVCFAFRLDVMFRFKGKYVCVCSKLSRLIYNVYDDPLLKANFDDSLRVEPEWYCPILPMVLVNGAEGIGTGWSTKIPNFNIHEIVANLKRMLDGLEPLPMVWRHAPFSSTFTSTLCFI